MRIALGFILIISGFFLAVGTVKDLFKRDFNEMIQGNNIKMIFAEITLIGLGVCVLVTEI
ncbi:MAG: hypothetical protein L0J60_09070 [Psychroflexus sp.]|nr:hypothetical protein [Psychroflexus sp.]